MENIQENIAQFLRKNRIATVCFADEQGKPYSFTCFFVFDEESKSLIFKSSFGTGHEDFSRVSRDAGGTVLPEHMDIAKIKGIQFSGCTMDAADVGPEYKSIYYKKFPFGRVMGGYIWVIRLESMKFTDNTIVFGSKTLWQRTAPVQAEGV